MSNNTEEKEVCQSHSFEKNKYFYGKLMTVSDFETEQSYFDGKRHLINRMLHGSGLICGFENITVEKSDGNLKISFIDGGVALDCCGREIVVPSNTKEEKIVNSSGDSVPDLPETSYLYLKYKACYDGYVGSASNPSSCEEKCCPGRIVEGFEVIASETASELKELECRSKPKGEEPEGEESKVESWLENLEKEHIVRPSCADKEWVFLATVVKDKNGKYPVNYEDTAKHRIFFTQKELYQLFKCHILDTNNPHDVTPTQIGALVSVEGVKGNDKGNVNLEPTNSIVINPTGPKDRITIGENHSPKKDNPHQVTAIQTGALVSIDGVSNPGGNVDLVAGANVSITPNSATHTIEIASTGGGGEVINPGNDVRSVGTSLGPGDSDRYSRENHEHDLGTEVVDVGNLSKKLKDQFEFFTSSINQINATFESLSIYLRKMTLINTITTFKEIGVQVSGNPDLVEIANKFAEKAQVSMNLRAYLKEEDFIRSVQDFVKLASKYERILRDSPGQIPKNILKELILLEEVVNEYPNNSLIIAIQLGESCFHLLGLLTPQ